MEFVPALQGEGQPDVPRGPGFGSGIASPIAFLASVIIEGQVTNRTILGRVVDSTGEVLND